MAMLSHALRLAAALLLLLSLSLTAAYEFAPILSAFVADEGTGSYEAAVQVCGERGAYLGAEPTVTTRTHHAELGGSTGRSDWYAFLGANVNAPANITPVCKASFVTDPTDTASAGDCIYRWKMGRYADFTDSSEAVASKWFYRSGISFYRGTLAAMTTSDCTYTINSTITMPCGPVSGYRSFFMTAANAPTGTDPGTYIANRPGFDNGHYVLLVGVGNTSVWSDNEPAGGYTYAGATKTGSTYAVSTTGIAATASSFIAVCDAQAPSRIMLEPYRDPKSNSNLLWWVIFLVILFVVLGIVFVILACCQEREDMDEPPEDAPEWAREEARQVTKPKRYVSQSSFRLVPQEDEYNEREMDSYSDVTSESGSETETKGSRRKSAGDLSERSRSECSSHTEEAPPETKENNWM